MIHRLANLKNRLFAEVTEVPEILSTNHFYSLDGFRAAAILYVIIAHLKYRYHIHWLDYVFMGGKLGVLLFFVISGFLITSLLLKEKIRTGTISLKDFYIRRLLRIVPVAYLYLFILLVLNYFFHLSIPLKAFLGAFLFIMSPYFSKSWYVAHYWSLAVEEQFYIIFPFVLKWGVKVYMRFLLLFFIVSILAHFNFFGLLGHNFFSDFIIQFTRYADGLIIGSLMAILMFKNMFPLVVLQKYKWPIHLVCVPVMIIMLNHHNAFLEHFSYTLCSLMIAIILAGNILPGRDLIFLLLNNKLMNFIGKLSYSLYIYNQLFTGPLAKGTWHSGNLPWYINALMLFGVAYLSYHYYESWFLKWKQRFKKLN